MAIINQNFPDDLLERVHKIARKKFGDKKGSKRLGYMAAMEEWVKKWENK